MNQLPLTTHSFFTIIHLFGTYNSTVGRGHSAANPIAQRNNTKPPCT